MIPKGFPPVKATYGDVFLLQKDGPAIGLVHQVLITKTSVATGDKIYGTISMKLNPEVLEWLRSYAGLWTWSLAGDNALFRFADPGRAMAFKLRWMPLDTNGQSN